MTNQNLGKGIDFGGLHFLQNEVEILPKMSSQKSTNNPRDGGVKGRCSRENGLGCEAQTPRGASCCSEVADDHVLPVAC